MTPRILKFVEQYLDEDPPSGPGEPRYWRGITAYLDDEWVFHMRLCLKEKRFDEPTHFTFETCLGVSGDKFRQTIYGVSKETREEAKEFAQERFNGYVRSLCMDEPNFDGGATTAELALALGSSIDEALDIHNEVERLANPAERIQELKHLIALEMDPFAQIVLQKELDEILRDN